MNSDKHDQGAPEGAPQIGYKSPPAKYKYKQGKSGNPKGRPKKAKGAGDIWMKIAQADCEMVIGGKTKKMMRIEAVATAVMAKAMKGDLKAALTVLQAYAQYGPAEAPNASAASADTDKAALTHLLSKFLPGGTDNAE